MMILIITSLCAVPIFILGIFLKQGKGLMLISGFNTMSKENQDKIDKKVLSNSVGNMLIRTALIFILLGISIYFSLTWVTFALIAFMIIDPCIFAVKMSKIMPKSKTSKVGIITTIVILVVTFIAVGTMFYYGEKEPVVTILDNNIQIEGMYGLDIDFSNITAISLDDKSMRDIGTGQRTNGYGGFGETLKGHFNSKSTGRALLFVKADSSPTIVIERVDKEYIYLSYSDGEKTRALYQELLDTVHLSK